VPTAECPKLALARVRQALKCRYPRRCDWAKASGAHEPPESPEIRGGSASPSFTVMGRWETAADAAAAATRVAPDAAAPAAAAAGAGAH